MPSASMSRRLASLESASNESALLIVEASHDETIDDIERRMPEIKPARQSGLVIILRRFQREH